MKPAKYLIIFLVLTSCITVRTVPSDPSQVNTKRIINGNEKEFKKLNLPPSNLLIFENYKGMVRFRKFLSYKYKIDNYLLTDQIEVQIEGTNFDMQIHTPNKTTQGYDLLGLALSYSVSKATGTEGDININDYNTTTENSYGVISIHFNEEDCLAVNSIFYNLASNYVQNLVDEYLLYE